MRVTKKHRVAIAAGASFALGVVVAFGIVRAMPSSSPSQSSGASAACGASGCVTPGSDETSTDTSAPTPSPEQSAQPGTDATVVPTATAPGAPPAPNAAAASSSGHGSDVAAASAPNVPPPSTDGSQAVAPAANPPASAPSSDATGFEAQYCATVLDTAGRSQCGNPPNFCDSWTGGFCQDYRDKQTAPHVEQAFPQAGDPTSLDCVSSTNAGQTDWLPYYVPTNMTEWDTSDVPQKENIPFPCGFSFMEHFMTRIEDGQFGMVIMREQHPFDFAGRTGHIHFDVDLKTMERRYPRLVLSPQLTKVAVDDRSMDPVTDQSFEIWFRNGTFQGKMTRNGQVVDLFPDCNGCGPRYYGQDNVRDSVDVYISRTHVKIVVNGATQVDQDIPDIGFDRAYVYLDHLNYNSCKAHAIEGYAGVQECQLMGNTFHWDDIAYDGPTLARNGLTPAGSEDVVFNAWSAASCTVKGVAAQGTGRDYVWQTWVARLPAGTAVSPADVVCSGGNNGGFHWYRGTPMGLEIVQPS